MKAVKLLIILSDELELKRVVIDYNDTGREDGKKLIVGIANALLEEYKMGTLVEEVKDTLKKG